MRSPSRSARRRRGARQSADQLRGRRKGAAASTPDLGRRARLAEPAAPLLGGQRLQPRLLRRAADGSQVPMLNVFHRDGETIRHFWGAELTFAPAIRAGSSQRWHPRAALEPVRPHARGAPGLGRAAELLMKSHRAMTPRGTRAADDSRSSSESAVSAARFRGGCERSREVSRHAGMDEEEQPRRVLS